MTPDKQEWNWDEGLKVLPDLKGVLSDDLWSEFYIVRMRVCSNMEEVRQGVTPDDIENLANRALSDVEGRLDEKDVKERIVQLMAAMHKQLYDPIQLRKRPSNVA